MGDEIINRLIKFWRESLFIEPFLIFLFALCFIVALFHHDRERERVAFLFYFLMGTALFLGTLTKMVFNNLAERKYHIIVETGNTFFELTEFVAFYYFFKGCLQSPFFKKMCKIFLFCLIAISSAFFVGLVFPSYATEVMRWHSLMINVIEFFFLSSMCLAYFYELFATV